MKKRLITSAALAILTVCAAWGQAVEDFSDACKVLRSELVERTTVHNPVRLDKVTVNNGKLDLVFNSTIGSFPWSRTDIEWFRSEVRNNFPDSWKSYGLGDIYCGKQKLDELALNPLGNNGQPSADYQYRVADPYKGITPVVERIDAGKYPKGLSGRHISIWQSHGRYYEQKTQRWEWQRAPLHRSVEDMYTQSYVIPFIMPMLENAGAYVLTPRERDTQWRECVCDNDGTFARPRSGKLRKKGTYNETGNWESAGEGFADGKEIYTGIDNPFTMGTARQASCIKKAGTGEARAVWTADIPEKGEYAVYISYKTVPGSTTAAHYTVHHIAGDTEFIVNQQIGGGTWIYLGTFLFENGNASVTLDNICPEGRKFAKKSVVTADAVRFGGGMGKVARGMHADTEDDYKLSGLPAFAEGAMYWMQWAGVDTLAWNHWKDNDYTNDYACRGAWTKWMLEEKGMPFDLSMAFHTDAGVSPDDSIVGTLSVYTLMADDSRKTVKGIDRMTGRLFAGYLQDQVCNDIRSDFEPKWSRRLLWDQSYSESRTTGVPGMLLEFLAHQNLADMKYGMDPAFRFTVSRAIYKSMLKTISELYGVPYVVQPLPVHNFSAILEGSSVKLSWEPTDDTKEPTAAAKSYLVQTRVDDGEFDAGTPVDGTTWKTEVGAGHIYSYRIVAVNEGGVSFPSEILSVGIAAQSKGKILVVNNFDRVSPATWFDTPQVAGFDARTDSGVPYIFDINYIGENFENRRGTPWTDDDNPGWGGSFSDYAGKLVAGNTFDFPALHGKALLDLGYSFCSASHEWFEKNSCPEVFAVDLICGKQVTCKIGAGRVPDRYQVFPEAMRNAVSAATAKGVNFFVSGADIATDIWDEVYPGTKNKEYSDAGKEFCQKVLGYKWLTGHGCYTGKISELEDGRYFNEINEKRYCVENPDGIVPADKNGQTVLHYSDNEIPAAVYFNGNGYKTACYGFPVEVLVSEKDIESVFEKALEFFK